jgi:hypothetical protein
MDHKTIHQPLRIDPRRPTWANPSAPDHRSASSIGSGAAAFGGLVALARWHMSHIAARNVAFRRRVELGYPLV